MLNISSQSFALYTDTENLLGLVKVPATDDPSFRVHFTGHGHWQIAVRNEVLARIKHGVPNFPRPRLRREQFERAFTRLFPQASADGLDQVWALADSALDQAHGTTIVVVGDAAEESHRLSGQGTCIERTALCPDLSKLLTAIDGAVILDPEGFCHAIGAILDGPACCGGDPGRGARFNSAVRYVNDRSNRMAIVVSQDGHADLLPRLRPQISRQSLKKRVDDALMQLREESVPTSAREECACLVQEYPEYLSDLASEDEVRRILLGSLAARGLLEEDRTPRVVYDMHPTDIVEEALINLA
jgi:hypothetical protein